ncbi:MAG TPA: hypothetical protein VIS99_06010 [Terrimicrobiaceae bacterium]
MGQQISLTPHSEIQRNDLARSEEILTGALPSVGDGVCVVEAGTELAAFLGGLFAGGGTLDGSNIGGSPGIKI